MVVPGVWPILRPISIISNLAEFSPESFRSCHLSQVLLASSDSETKPNKAASGSSDLKKKVAPLKDQKPKQMEDALHGGLEI